MKNPKQQPVFRLQFWSRRTQRAFSLYEALVSLVIVGTVASIAVPSLQQIVSSQRMTVAINTLITALYLARSEAIKRGQDAILCPSTNGRSCIKGASDWGQGYLLFIDRNDNHELDADDAVLRIFEESKGLRLTNTSIHDHVRYQPNGTASLTNATFTFCSINGQTIPKAVIISNGGRARTSTQQAEGDPIVCLSGL